MNIKMCRSMGRLLVLMFMATFLSCSEVQDAPAPALVPTPAVLSQAEREAVKVAVLAIRSAVAANAQYGPIIAYLAEALSRPVQLVPVDQASQFAEVAAGRVDFTLNNPLAATQLRRLYATQFLATLSRQQTGTQFGGLIIVKASSDVIGLEGLRGMRVKCVGRTEAEI